MIKEISAKQLLTHTKNPDSWFGVKYNMNIYRGCEHGCIYCDSRSECYHIENFNDVLVKTNSLELLQKELSSKRIKGIVGTGAMSDPYTKCEETYNLTGDALKIIARYGYPIHIITKSDLVLRDMNTLIEINKVHASICFTLTTIDDALAKKLEPGAPLPSSRLAAMKELSSSGIFVGVTMMPILPFIEDSEDNIKSIIENAAAHGAKYIIPWFGMSLRDRQRAYYYKALDILFPEMKTQYEKTYGNNYVCSSPNFKKLGIIFDEQCRKYGLISNMKDYVAAIPEFQPTQLSLF